MAGTFPIRTPPFDKQGNWNRPLVDFFNSLTTAQQEPSGATVVSVLDFCDVVDGVTDNTLGVNAALASLIATGGGTLWFPAHASAYVFGDVVMPAWPTIVNVRGDGINATCFTTPGRNQGLFAYNPTVTANFGSPSHTFYGFTVRAHRLGATAAHPAIDIEGWFRWHFDSIGYESSPATVTTGQHATFSFVAPSTIHRSSGSFLADGFLAGGEISVSGAATAANNVPLVIATVTATDLTVTGATLANEAAGASVEVFAGDFAVLFYNSDTPHNGGYNTRFRRIIITAQHGPQTILHVAGQAGDVVADDWQIVSNSHGLFRGIFADPGAGIVRVRNGNFEGNEQATMITPSGGLEVSGNYFEQNLLDVDLFAGGVGSTNVKIQNNLENGHGLPVVDFGLSFNTHLAGTFGDSFYPTWKAGVTPPANGEWHYGNQHWNIALPTMIGGVKTRTVSAPGFFAPFADFNQVTGLPAGDYEWQVTATDATGETTALAAAAITITGPQAPAVVHISFVGSNGAASFNVYGRSSHHSTVDVDATGLILTKTAGAAFAANQVGYPIAVNGVGAVVATFVDATHVTLVAGGAVTGPQTGVASYWNLGQYMATIPSDQVGGQGGGISYFSDDGTITPSGAYNPKANTTGQVVSDGDVKGTNFVATGVATVAGSLDVGGPMSVGDIVDHTGLANWNSSVPITDAFGRMTAWSSFNSGQAGGFFAQRGRGTSAAPTDVQSGDVVGYFHALGWLNGTFQSACVIEGAMNNVSGGAAFGYDGVASFLVRSAVLGTVYDWAAITLTHTGATGHSIAIDGDVGVTGAVNAASLTSAAGYTGTATVRNAAGTGTSSFTIVGGVITGYTP